MPSLPDRPYYLNHALKHEIVGRLAASARRVRTPHADGQVMWHEWGQGAPLILLHGNFGSWLHWLRNIEILSRHFRVLAADLPGLGESDPVMLDAAQEHATAADIATPLIAGIRQLTGENEALNILSFSLGSVIGSQVASGLSDRLRKVVLVGAPGLGDTAPNSNDILQRRQPGMNDADRRELVRHNLLQCMVADPAAIDELLLDLQTDLLAQRRRLFGQPISRSDAIPRSLPQLAGRATIIWGERDFYIAPDVDTVARRAAQRWPEIDIRVIRGAGHWVAYEAAAELNAALLDALGAG